MYHVMKDSCYGSLVRSPRIFEAKRHYSVIKVPDWSSEWRFLCIFGSHANLVVPTVPIHKQEHRASCSRIYKEVDIGQGELIFWTCLIQVVKVHTTTNLTIFLFHRYYVGKLFGVLDRFNKTSY